MSKQPPFEELDERWSDLPLPDADAAWRDMSALLDKDDCKAPPIIPAFLSGCAGWGLLLLVLSVGAIGLYWYRSSHPGTSPTAVHPSQSSPITNPTQQSTQTDTSAVATIPDHRSPSESDPTPSVTQSAPSQPGAGTDNPEPAPTSKKKNDRSTSVARTGTSGSANPTMTGQPAPASVTAAPTSSGNILVAGPPAAVKKGRKPATGTKTARRKAATAAAGTVALRKEPWPVPTPAAGGDNSGLPTPNDPTLTPKPSAQADGTIPSANAAGTTKSAASGPPDSSVTAGAKTPVPVALPGIDSAARVSASVDSLAATATREAAKKRARRAPWLSAGVGLSQAVPIGGQNGSGANYQGRYNPFTEHVPSVWLRVHKGRWFLQGEARFNAPQLLPGLSFYQKTRLDTATHSLQTDRQQLRKVWYHQFPFTANYQLLRRWSIGAGFQWSVLYRAAGERISYRRDLANNLSRESAAAFQVPGYRDSFLYQSQWQLVLQTEWSWRRWGLGLRYRRDLQPYLRYTRPEGEVRDEFNEAFEATIRFWAWQSKRRR
ncbi:DUF5585 domain-containing protein [Flaviaesturariibacter terrae]